MTVFLSVIVRIKAGIRERVSGSLVLVSMGPVLVVGTVIAV